MKEPDIENHSLLISERENTNISGIKKVLSFDDEEFLLDTVLGQVEIKGYGLEIVKLDTYQGTISIKGIINTVEYLEDNKRNSSGILSKLFK